MSGVARVESPNKDRPQISQANIFKHKFKNWDFFGLAFCL